MSSSDANIARSLILHRLEKQPRSYEDLRDFARCKYINVVLGRIVDQGLATKEEDQYKITSIGKAKLRKELPVYLKRRGATPSPIIRHDKCPHFPTCLELAMRSGWDGFHCGDCPIPGVFRVRSK